MKVCFDGIGEQVVTFLNDTSAPCAAGDAVALSASGTVKKAAADAVFCGICLGGDGDCAAVQLGGVVTREYTGTTAPSLGYDKLVAAADGKVSAKSTGREYLVLTVDTTAKTVTFVL